MPCSLADVSSVRPSAHDPVQGRVEDLGLGVEMGLEDLDAVEAEEADQRTAALVDVAEDASPGRAGLHASGSQALSNAALLELEVDVLVPAALETQITEVNAERVRPRILAEAANGPTTPDADVILARNGVFLIPDILCNAGGVTVSYFEWVQDLNRDQWSEDIVNSKLTEIMVRSFSEVVRMAEAEEVDMRLGAYLLAVDRVASAQALRGLYP
jgi:glutamate dehydrogenase/leucine dehydrogenase